MLSLNMRKYGDALDKFEPNDLNKAMCPSTEWLDKIPISDIQKELSHIRNFGKISDHGEAMFSNLIESTPNNLFQQTSKSCVFAPR